MSCTPRLKFNLRDKAYVDEKCWSMKEVPLPQALEMGRTGPAHPNFSTPGSQLCSAATLVNQTTTDQPEMKRARRFTKTPIAAVFLIISLFFVTILLSLHKLPRLSRPKTNINIADSELSPPIGTFGKMMIDMLPIDLPFTVFLPSEEAFSQILKLKVNESLKGEQLNDTVAVLSRVLGFSVVPRAIRSGEVVLNGGEEMDFDSLSGFRLGIWREEDGRLLVNGVRSKSVDCRVGEIVVHVMDGVIMDADFEQSFREEEDDDEG